MIYRIFNEQSIRSSVLTRGSIMANDVRREAIEDRLRRRERDKIEEREKPEAQGLLNFACITHLSHLVY